MIYLIKKGLQLIIIYSYVYFAFSSVRMNYLMKKGLRRASSPTTPIFE